MRLGVSMYSYYAAVKDGRLDIGSFIHEAAKAGAEGVELLDFFYKDLDRDRETVQKALKESGLPCPIFSVAQNFAKIDPGEREEQLNKVLFGIDEAAIYRSKVVRVFAGDVAPGISFDQARAWIIEGLSEASSYAADQGIKLALENHGQLAGRGDQVRGIIDDVRDASGVDALGANPDTGNFVLVNQASHEAIRQVADYANMVHFKDFKPDPNGRYHALDGSKWEGVVVGEGTVDLAACIGTLRDAGYNGWLSVEYEGEEDPLTAVPRCLSNARKYL